MSGKSKRNPYDAAKSRLDHYLNLESPHQRRWQQEHQLDVVRKVIQRDPSAVEPLERIAILGTKGDYRHPLENLRGFTDFLKGYVGEYLAVTIPNSLFSQGDECHSPFSLGKIGLEDGLPLHVSPHYSTLEKKLDSHTLYPKFEDDEYLIADGHFFRKHIPRFSLPMNRAKVSGPARVSLRDSAYYGPQEPRDPDVFDLRMCSVNLFDSFAVSHNVAVLKHEWQLSAELYPRAETMITEMRFYVGNDAVQKRVGHWLKGDISQMGVQEVYQAALSYLSTPRRPLHFPDLVGQLVGFTPSLNKL